MRTLQVRRVRFSGRNRADLNVVRSPTIASAKADPTNFAGPTENSALHAYRDGRWPNTVAITFGRGVEVDAWLTELARPDSGLTGLTMLNLGYTQVTDAGLKELARPDSGLKALAALDLGGTRVTDSGVAALKAARPGLVVYH